MHFVKLFSLLQQHLRQRQLLCWLRALYCESLGKDLGLFTDPYQYLGALGDEIHRAIRLVVDTGIHTKGWTREQALQYMLENEAISVEGATAEIERYHVLIEKLELGTMTDAEHAEFDILGNKEEKLRNQRVKNMIELAQLRAVSLSEVMVSLGLKPTCDNWFIEA